MKSSRRRFLAQLSATAGVGLLSQLPGSRLWAIPPSALVPDLEDALLRELALVAVDAARSAGAAFADVRIAAGQSLGVGCQYVKGNSPQTSEPGLTLETGYGIRALIDGAWGFAAAQDLTPGAVARTAQAAVTRARANRPRRPRTMELAPTPPVANGRWAISITEDPFLVPFGAQTDLQLAAIAAVAAMPQVQSAGLSFHWMRANRVFASSEGSLLVQRTTYARTTAGLTATAGEQYPRVDAGIAPFYEPNAPGGYEIVSRRDLPAELRRVAERAVEDSKRPTAPPTPAEVGRYDLVVGARSAAVLLVNTLAAAVDAERALGYRANGVGTSFAAPPADILGKYQVASPLVTVRADRTRPDGAATVGWDDEGVKTEAFTLIRDGVIMDYLTNRQTAGELAEWYRQRGEPVRSHGCASGAGRERPVVRMPNLTLEPGKGNTSLDDLIADTKRGIYVEEVWGDSDQQLLSGQFRGGKAWQIRNGKLGGPIHDLALQFVTPAFWNSLDALGGPSTTYASRHIVAERTFDSLQVTHATVSSVPARFRQVNVLNTGRIA